MTGRHLSAYSVGDLQSEARQILPRGIYDFIERGAENEITHRSNRIAFDAIRLRPRAARDVSSVDVSTTLFGRPLKMPLAIAPTGGAGIVRYRGDLALAQAAAGAGVPFTISSVSTIDLEQLIEAGARTWFQLYLWEDRELSMRVVDRARSAGCEALIMTLDIPVSPNREHSLRAGFEMPFRLGVKNAVDVLTHPRWIMNTYLPYVAAGGLPRQANLPRSLQARITAAPPRGARFHQSNMTWDEVARIREKWPGVFMVKGILSPEDAQLAVSAGVDGIIVSNHGGRSVDGVMASIDVLPAISKAVGSAATILLDSGVRRGSDIAKAIALGAKAVLIGRPALFGLAAGGASGVARAIQLLSEEFERTIAMCGLCTVDQIDSAMLLQDIMRADDGTIEAPLQR